MSAISHVRSAVAAGAVAATALAGCASTGPGGTSPRHPGPGGTARSSGLEQFSRPTVVTNAMFPLRPGTEFSYQGRVAEGGRSSPHTVTFTVTSLTKVVDGVRTVVAWDRDYYGGKLKEQELAFFAQDDQGNVWNFGEYPEEYSARGRFTGAPDTWIRGTAGAYGGLHMLARPVPGARYREGLVPRIEFDDVSMVATGGQATCVPAGCYRGVLRVNEWSPNDPASGIQVKYYAPGVGLVRVGALGGDSREYLTLASVRHLSVPQLAAVRAAALAIDHRAYRVSGVYRATGPAGGG